VYKLNVRISPNELVTKCTLEDMKAFIHNKGLPQ
jgi:hypothetical protein